MTFSTLINRITKRWWVILILTALIGFGGYYLLNKPIYTSSVSLNMNFNNIQKTASDSETRDQAKENAYVYGLNNFSQFLSNRLQSPTMEKEVWMKVEDGNEEAYKNSYRRMYKVTPEGMGFVSIDYQNSSEEKAKKFNEAIKKVFNEKLIPEWNATRQEQYKVSPNNINSSIIVKNQPGLELLITPVLAGVLISNALAVFTPLKEESKEIDKKTKS
jgi:capsular polysaccharide biosynthesis protein